MTTLGPLAPLPAAITIREVGPRDGLQNEDPISADAKVHLINALSRTGVSRIEAVSFVHPDVIPQMADADEVWGRIKREPSVRYSALVPNMRGADARDRGRVQRDRGRRVRVEHPQPQERQPDAPTNHSSRSPK